VSDYKQEDGKRQIALWRNSSSNAKAPPLTGKATCPCCDAEMRVALWPNQKDSEGKQPRLRGEVEAQTTEQQTEVSNDLLDEVIEECGVPAKDTPSNPKPLKSGDIPF